MRADGRSAQNQTAVIFRTYGASGPLALVLHGGPGAPGYMAPLAQRLADSYRVFEPMQRGSGGEPLSVGRHVEDLHEFVQSHCDGERPSLIGHSWGAMLALAYAAAHAGSVASLVLIGCGTFDSAARDRMRAIRDERMDDLLQRRLERLPLDYPDPDQRLNALGDMYVPLDSYDLGDTDTEFDACDSCAYDETWDDMLRLQAEGAFPAAFAAIDVPVIMLHGAFDPHPGLMIRASLLPHLPQLEYREWERCGHYPWLERAVGEEFLAVLRKWLGRHLNSDPDGADV